MRNLRVGDAIALKTRQGDFDYVVESTFVVGPTDVWVLDARGGHTLTLITCYPFSYIGPAPDRFIVRAREALIQQQSLTRRPEMCRRFAASATVIVLHRIIQGRRVFDG